MLDVAQGLKYLHNMNPNIIHADLKGVSKFGRPLYLAFDSTLLRLGQCSHHPLTQGMYCGFRAIDALGISGIPSSIELVIDRRSERDCRISSPRTT